MKSFDIIKKIGCEIFFGLCHIIGGTLETKITLAIFLLIPGVAIFFSKEIIEDNYWLHYSIGTILIILSFILFISKIKELKKNSKSSEKI